MISAAAATASQGCPCAGNIAYNQLGLFASHGARCVEEGGLGNEVITHYIEHSANESTGERSPLDCLAIKADCLLSASTFFGVLDAYQQIVAFVGEGSGECDGERAAFSLKAQCSMIDNVALRL